MTVEQLQVENARLKAEVEAHEKRWAESEDLISHYKQQRDEAINDCRCSRLKAEVERLTALVESNLNSSKLAIGKADAVLHERDSLKAEVERLRKAGDGLYKSMLEIGCNEMADNFQYDDWWGSMRAWQSAKEGKQS